MGDPVALADLHEVNPGLARGFQQLLDYNGEDIFSVFPYTFQIDYEGIRQLRQCV